MAVARLGFLMNLNYNLLVEGEGTMRRIEPDALALEYKGVYGTARRDLDISNLVNNPTASGKCRVLGDRLPEQLRDFRGRNSRYRSAMFDPIRLWLLRIVSMCSRSDFSSSRIGLVDIKPDAVKHECRMRGCETLFSSHENSISNRINVPNIVHRQLERHCLKHVVQVHAVHHGTARRRNH